MSAAAAHETERAPPARRRALLRVLPEVLAQQLGLEPGVRVLAMTMDERRGLVTLLLEGGSLPESRAGDAMPSVELLYHLERDGAVHRFAASWSHAPERRWFVGPF